MRSGWQCKTQASALTPGALNECSMLSIRPNLAAWAWDYRSVGRLLKVTVGGSGPYPTMVLVRLFILETVAILQINELPVDLLVPGLGHAACKPRAGS